MDILTVNIEQCGKVAEELRKVEVFFEDVYDPRFYPPKDEGDVSIANYLFYVVAIDHRTHKLGEVFQGVVEGRMFRGATLLWRLAMLKHVSDPKFFTAGRLKDVAAEEVSSWLTVHEPKLRVAGEPDVRALLLRDCAIRLIEKYDGSFYELIKRSGGWLLREDGSGLLQLLSEFKAYEDPVRKKSFLLIKLLERRGILKVKDPENLEVPVDNHLARIALRTGMVMVDSERLREALISRRPVTREEDFIIRMASREAYKIISKETSIKPTYLDDVFWNLGRNCCKRENPACRFERCYMNECELSRMISHGCRGRCPLTEACKGALNNHYKEIQEPNYQTWYY